MNHEDVETAVRRLRDLEDAAGERRQLYLTIANELQGVNREVAQLTRQLSDARRLPQRERSAKREQRIENQLTAKTRERDRKIARRDQLAEEANALRDLTERCREFLEQSGGRVEDLEAGNPSVPGHAKTTTEVS